MYGTCCRERLLEGGYRGGGRVRAYVGRRDGGKGRRRRIKTPETNIVGPKGRREEEGEGRMDGAPSMGRSGGKGGGKGGGGEVTVKLDIRDKSGRKVDLGQIIDTLDKAGPKVTNDRVICMTIYIV